MNKKQTFLLHCCCAPCSTHPLQILMTQFTVTAFFYNPNVHPHEEYSAREKDMRYLANKWKVPCIIGSYEVDEWFDAIKGFEEEVEGGSRCEICYRFRLEGAARVAKERKIDFFGTTLSVSPHKNHRIINQIGGELSTKYKIHFYESDFKKKDGFKISCNISREEGLYRQNYCGCVFSRKH